MPPRRKTRSYYDKIDKMPKTHKYFHKDFISNMYRDKRFHTRQEKIEIMRLRDLYLRVYRRKHYLNVEVKLVVPLSP